MQKFNANAHLFDWFKQFGAYVSVDGQYGSTGKGVINAALAEAFGNKVDVVTSNAGPNSGHTSYYEGEKIILKQLPTFGVTAFKRFKGDAARSYLNAGAVINPHILAHEVNSHRIGIIVNPRAAVITDSQIMDDSSNVYNIASTGQGVGPAIQAKLSRNPKAIVAEYQKFLDTATLNSVLIAPLDMHPRTNCKTFIEVSQGFSLGLNQMFYPNVTTRECTVSQALADAGLPPTAIRKTIMSVRAHPIRVGNTENSSGNCYPDQKETSWEELGVEPETTTVTGRTRRVFTWSNIQFAQALRANDPNVIFVNFLNYIGSVHSEKVHTFLENVETVYSTTLKRPPDAILAGFGPTSDSIYTWGVWP